MISSDYFSHKLRVLNYKAQVTFMKTLSLASISGNSSACDRTLATHQQRTELKKPRQSISLKGVVGMLYLFPFHNLFCPCLAAPRVVFPSRFKLRETGS